MATKIAETGSIIIFENTFAEIHVSKKNSLVEKIIYKPDNKDITGEKCPFFSISGKDGKELEITSVSLTGNVMTAATDNGSFDVKVECFDNFFTFELLTSLPEGCYKATLAHAKFSYDPKDENGMGALGIPMTYWADAKFYPDVKSCETAFFVLPHLKDVGAKYAVIICPTKYRRGIMKEVCLKIDKNVGIVSSIGGAFGRDSRLCFGNYTLQYESSKEFIDSMLPFFKKIGVDQIDFHQGSRTYRQGDFKTVRYETMADFKKNVSDRLEEHGMSAGLHTYAQYINYDCDTLLSQPKFQKDLITMNSFTLAEDIGENTMFLPTVESVECLSMDRGFFRKNSAMILVGEELMTFNKGENGLIITQRGKAGTKAVPHKKGEEIKHLEGFFGDLTPRLGSELFLEVARLTAKAFNEGGFKMIYLDAIDGLRQHCKREEVSYYMGAFICELLKNCNTDPLLEASDMVPSFWAARGRIGAWDTPYRGYRGWNNIHTNDNLQWVDRFSAPCLGWYDFFPMTEAYPGNEHTKYHHTDSIEHMASKAIMYDFSTVFNGLTPEKLERYAGMRRNLAIYKKYDDLRKAEYFSEDYRQKLIDGPFEYHLKEKRGGKYTFVEKDYQTAKLYDLSDSDRNYGNFKNPFGAQIPFVRIEAMLSTLKNNPMVMMKLNDDAELMTQKLSIRYGCEINFKDNLAKVVKVFGNGKGGKVCLKTRCATKSEAGYGQYIIDVNFKGWREFILLESDNGERFDHGFEKNEIMYPVFRSSLNNDRLVGMEIETEGDMEGVRMSSIVAYEHTYEVYKNPTVKIGEGTIMFECELQSSDVIEWDGKEAKVLDRYGNERPIWFNAENFKSPRGKFKAELTARALNRTTPRAQLTLGFTGKEVK